MHCSMWMSECSFSFLLLLRCCLLSTSLLCQRPRQAPRTFPCTPSYLRWSPWCYFLSCVFSSHACSATGEWEPSNGEPRSPSPGQEMYNKAMQRWRKRYYRFLSFFLTPSFFLGMYLKSVFIPLMQKVLITTSNKRFHHWFFLWSTSECKEK